MMRALFFGWIALATALPAVAQLAMPVGPGPQPGAPQGGAGIGAVLLTREGAAVINQVIPNSPAAESGAATAGHNRLGELSRRAGDEIGPGGRAHSRRDGLERGHHGAAPGRPQTAHVHDDAAADYD